MEAEEVFYVNALTREEEGGEDGMVSLTKADE
jgi:hypothetical protein